MRNSGRRGMGDSLDDGDGGDSDLGGDGSEMDLGGDTTFDGSSLLGSGNGTYNGVSLGSVSTYLADASNSTNPTNTVGQITSFLTQAGLTAAQVIGVLNQTSTQQTLTAAQNQYLQQELAYANALATSQTTSKNNLLLLAVVGIGAVFLLMDR